jgi:DNA-binding GntR family transcriptional regulator
MEIPGGVRGGERAGGPIWARIEASLRERIESGELGPGQRLPAERDMARQLGVSRMTVRQALAALADRGLVERGVGQGTFVSGAGKVDHQLGTVVGLTEVVAKHGLVAGARVLEARERGASAPVATALGREDGAPVVRLRRLRLAGGRPIAIEDDWMPAELVPGLLEHDLSGSLCLLLREHYGFEHGEVEERLEPVAAGAFEARVLGVGVGAPLMLVERVVQDPEGRPIKFSRHRHRGDRSRFVIRSGGRL